MRAGNDTCIPPGTQEDEITVGCSFCIVPLLLLLLHTVSRRISIGPMLPVQKLFCRMSAFPFQFTLWLLTTSSQNKKETS